MSITALHEQAQAEVQEFSDSEDDGAVVVALPRMPRPEKIDIKSCEQFLLELFQQWMSPYVQPRTSLMLLTDATKAVSTKSGFASAGLVGQRTGREVPTMLSQEAFRSERQLLHITLSNPTSPAVLNFLSVEINGICFPVRVSFEVFPFDGL